MNPITTIAGIVAHTLPDYPAERVLAVAESLGEPVLWSGRAYGKVAVDGMATTAAWFVVLAVAMALVMVSAAYRGRTWRDSITGDEKWAPAGTFVPAFALSVACLVAAAWAGHYASDMSTRGVAITATRIVVVSNGERRTDIPAASVSGVTRVGGKLTLRVARQADLQMEPDPSEAEAVSKAVDRFSTRLAMR